MLANKQKSRIKRHYSIRKKIIGSSTIPRINVFKSNMNFYAQVIDDDTHKTLVSCSTLELKLKKNNCEAASQVGKELAKRLKEKNIGEIVFDRSGYLYHGRIANFATALREEGIKF